jgi:hypothetical protein
MTVIDHPVTPLSTLSLRFLVAPRLGESHAKSKGAKHGP